MSNDHVGMDISAVENMLGVKKPQSKHYTNGIADCINIIMKHKCSWGGHMECCCGEAKEDILADIRKLIV